MNLKKIGKIFTSKIFGTGPSSYKKIIYRAAVSQRLRNTDIDRGSCNIVTVLQFEFWYLNLHFYREWEILIILYNPHHLTLTLQAVWGWHDSVETCSSVIICEIIVCISGSLYKIRAVGVYVPSIMRKIDTDRTENTTALLLPSCTANPSSRTNI